MLGVVWYAVLVLGEALYSFGELSSSTGGVTGLLVPGSSMICFYDSLISLDRDPPLGEGFDFRTRLGFRK